MSYASESAADRLAAVRNAIAKVLNAQSYSLKDRQTQYAQLRELRQMETELQREVAAGDSSSGGLSVGQIDVSP